MGEGEGGGENPLPPGEGKFHFLRGRRYSPGNLPKHGVIPDQCPGPRSEIDGLSGGIKSPASLDTIRGDSYIMAAFEKSGDGKGGMEDYIIKIFRESSQLKEAFVNENLVRIVAVVEAVTEALKGGNKILLFGNGGAAGGAPHPAAGIVKRLRGAGRPPPATAPPAATPPPAVSEQEDLVSRLQGCRHRLDHGYDPVEILVDETLLDLARFSKYLDDIIFHLALSCPVFQESLKVRIIYESTRTLSREAGDLIPKPPHAIAITRKYCLT